jgi:AcrR family transcriptional regulator
MSETPKKIIQSAIEIWGSDMQASLDDIASNINISRRTLHRHFSGRDDLLKSVFNNIFQESLNEVKAISKAYINLEERLAELFKHDLSNGSRFQVFCQIRKVQFQDLITQNPTLIELRKYYLDLFEELISQNSIRKELTVAWVETMYLSTIESASIIKEQDQNAMAWTTFWNGIEQ